MPADPDLDPLAETLVLDDEISLSVARLESAPDDDELAHWDSRNADVLHGLLALDEGPRLAEDGSEAVAQELQRLERKLDLVIDLLADVLNAQRPMGDRVRVRLSERGLQWPLLAEPLRAGQLLRLDLLPHSRYPVPVRLCARVVGDAAAAGAACTVVFVGMSEATRELLAKLIFRAHRRRIGRSRDRRT